MYGRSEYFYLHLGPVFGLHDNVRDGTYGDLRWAEDKIV
jgi:hypothetical protein